MPTVPFDSDTSHHSYDFNAYKPSTRKHSCSTSINGIIRVGETSVGKGVFARRQIQEGLLLSEIHGKVLDDYPEDSSYCMALPSGKLLEPAAPLRFLNHSCDPNCELFYWEDQDITLQEDRLWLQTIRPIVPGEQLLIDYCWPADAAIPCQCGAATCRGWIVDSGRVPPSAGRRKLATMEPPCSHIDLLFGRGYGLSRIRIDDDLRSLLRSVRPTSLFSCL